MMIGALLLLSLCSLGASLGLALFKARLWLASTLLALGTGLVASLTVLSTGTPWEWLGGFTIGGQTVHLRLDELSAFFLALLCLIGGTGAAYSKEYWSDKHYPASAPRGRLWWSALVLNMALVLIVSNGLHFLIAWELFALSNFFLLTLDTSRVAVRKAGWLYLSASHTGTLALFAFFTLLNVHTGSWDLGPLRDHANLTPLFWLALLGFGIKAGLFPLHVWLPSAHASAPSHASAIMSGVAIKLGIYGLLRFSGWLPVPAAAGWVVISLGAFSALLGIAFAFAQNDVKRLLAYCSVENIGVIFIGIGTALLAAAHGNAAFGALALAGALFHTWNHGSFKALLFLSAGSVLHATGTREISRLGGLWSRMPWTAGMFTLGALAVSGLPPLNGFVSEWLIYLGLIDATTARSTAAVATMPALILMAMAGALALATFVKAAGLIFLGAPRTKAAAHAHECGPWMRAPMLVLASVCLLLGLAPALVWPLLCHVVGAWNPAWETLATNSASASAASSAASAALSTTAQLAAPTASTSAAPSALQPAFAFNAPPLLTLSLVNVGLAAALVFGGLWLWRKIRDAGLRRSLTWDCGYAVPTARMQYTSGSFAELATHWFRSVLRPTQVLHRPKGLLPVRAFHLHQTPDSVLTRLLTPLSSAILRVSTAVRHLQHGHLQYYILYLVAGLLALGLIVILGGTL